MSSQGVPHLANQPHPLLHGTDSKNRPSHTSVCGGLFYFVSQYWDSAWSIFGQFWFYFYVFEKNTKCEKPRKIGVSYFTKTYWGKFEPCHLDHIYQGFRGFLVNFWSIPRFFYVNQGDPDTVRSLSSFSVHSMLVHSVGIH